MSGIDPGRSYDVIVLGGGAPGEHCAGRWSRAAGVELVLKARAAAVRRDGEDTS